MNSAPSILHSRQFEDRLGDKPEFFGLPAIEVFRLVGVVTAVLALDRRSIVGRCRALFRDHDIHEVADSEARAARRAVRAQ